MKHKLMKLSEKYRTEFEHQIISRGKDYFISGKVLSCIKSSNMYVSKVEGSYGHDYRVIIDVTEDGLSMTCTCPYDNHCKHEYATLLAIDHKCYKEACLKPAIEKTNYTIYEIIENIPAEELKRYILSNKRMNYVKFDFQNFEKQFVKYLPKEDYEYYYNNLYNEFILEEDVINKIHDYMFKVKQYIDVYEYGTAFIILKAIIESGNDTGYLSHNNNSFIEQLPVMGMHLRIINRKGDTALIKEIKKWIQVLEDHYYYNNCYLEDMILSLR